MANASDRKSIRAAEKASKLAEQNRRMVLVGLMSTTQGREWVWNKLAEANIFHSTFDDNAIRMAFNEGKRSAGLALLDDVLQACPDEFTLAMREHNGRRTESDIIDNARAEPDTSIGERPSSAESGRELEGQSVDADDNGGEGDGVEARLEDLTRLYSGEGRGQGKANGVNRRA